MTRHKPSQRLKESIDQGLLAHMSKAMPDYVEGILEDKFEDKEYQIQNLLSNPLVYSASNDPNTMYMDQAMHAPDKKEFLAAMEKEV